MSTVADEVKVEEVPRVAEFTPPRVRIGQEIFWYDCGDPNANPSTAVVVKVTGPSLKVRITDRSRMSEIKTCRHIKDPWLETHRSAKVESGAWDHTEETRNRETERKVMLMKIEALERRVGMLEAGVSGEVGEGDRKNYFKMSSSEIREALVELGVEIDPTWTRPALMREYAKVVNN